MNGIFVPSTSIVSDNGRVGNVTNFSCSKVHCIFCARDCPPAFAIENGKVTRIAEEFEQTSFPSKELILSRQLDAINTAKHILNISDETCYKLLSQFDGQFNPEFWMKVCSSCEIFVKQFNSSRKEIKRLEEMMMDIKVKLKGLISTSTVDTGLGIDFGFWKKIRDEALIGYSGSSFVEPEQSSSSPVEQIQVDEDVKNIVMDVEVEPEFQVKREQENSDSENESWETASATRQPFLIAKTVEPLPEEEENEVSPTHPAENSIADEIATQDSTFDPLEFLNLNQLNTDRDRNEKTKRKRFKNSPKTPKKIVKPQDTINTTKIKCNLCPLTLNKTSMQHHRNLHKGSGVPCPTCGIFMHRSRITSHQRSEKCLKIVEVPVPRAKPKPSFAPKINPPKRKLEKTISELTTADLRKDFFFGKNIHDHVPVGFTKLAVSTKGNSVTLYQCIKCPGKVKREDVTVHQGLHKDKTFYWSSICFHCGIYVLQTELSDHERKECPGNPREEREPVAELEEIETDEDKPYYYKCKECSASLKSAELPTHLALHENGSSSKNVCIICSWLVTDINQHHVLWHSNNSQLNTNAWALGQNYWVVDASNPNYTMFRQEYVSKFECKICEAKVFEKEEMEEHVKWHETEGREGSSCESVTWKKISGLSGFHRFGDEFTSEASLRFTKYWDCGLCDARCLLEGKREHEQLHESGDGVSCYACGLMIKVIGLEQHMEYFHPDL
ncbi:unnamed protein product [Orchesella dallaii]|uniref:C2H2-type domain-containing protein n=1 Tax=Orchesella dallaii TaxID=48710 RepID=A0ABP1S476_9HEXA